MALRILQKLGIGGATVLLVTGIVLAALLLDWSSTLLLSTPQVEAWMLIDILIASVIATPITYTLLKLLQRSHRQQLELADALAEVRELKGLLPVCAGCKRVRDDDGYWEQIDVYIHKHTRAEITHGLCPACVDRYYPGLFDKRD
ncbi:MAG TPA: hypothetical protein VNI58_00675 [Mariprofundaceae bacterium]|nr:hypothetical protein [Mariprofundaceae bacterium]